ncbi:MAG: uroporphyrinogen-III synthase [Alphaproteobacteria bacterium]
MSSPAAGDGALRGVRVVVFEARRAAETARLLERHGACVIAAPALREVPLSANRDAVECLDRLRRGEIDVFVATTGVGFRLLVETWSEAASAGEVAEMLSRTSIVARGPKPVQALREIGLVAKVVAGEPNTWREVLAAIDAGVAIGGRTVAVQEYGRPNRDLQEGLVARGATVVRVPVYRWALPEDTAPLRAAAATIARGEAEVAAFTTAVQLDHLLQVADLDGLREAVLAALRDRVVVAAIGPSVREALEAIGLRADVEPIHPKLGWFAGAIAEHAPGAIAARRAGSAGRDALPPPRRDG